MIELRPFQKRFLKGALANPSITRAGLSLSRGQGKSTLAAYILKRALTPGDSLHIPGAEYLLLSGSLEQARQVFNPLVAELDEDDYRVQTSTTRLGIHHKATATTLRVVSSKAKTAFGLGANNPIVIADEPGVWEANSLMNDALDTALGKPDAKMKIVYIGTLAPSKSGWWHDFIEDGSHGSTYVMALRGNPDKWDKASEIRRCNPLMWLYPDSRKTLLEERDAARADTRLKARFLSYRLNVPTGDESTVLLTVDDWERVLARPVPERQGRPIAAIDLAAGRAWSAATVIYPNGRLEALAVAPGLPSIEEQERRDRVPRGTYQRLVDSGALRVAEGLRVQPPSQLVDAMIEKWGKPEVIICDRFRLAELQDVSRGIPIQPRVSRWSESSDDIRGLRKVAMDGPLSCELDSRLLLTASLSAAMVENDTSGNVRLKKRGVNNEARDDVAAALILNAGAYQRSMARPKRRWRYRGAA